MSGGRCILPVLFDGRPARMILDTGAERTTVTRAAAARLGLRRDLWVDTPMAGAGGRLEQRPDADAATATLGGLKLFQNSRQSGLSLAVTDLPLGGADGLLGADLLRHHTLELDAAEARLLLWPYGIKPGAKPGAKSGAKSGAANVVPLRAWGQGLLLAPLRVDGRALTALLDTGSSTTLINASGLYKLGIPPARAAQDPVVIAAELGGVFQARAHRFTSLQFGRFVQPQPLLLTAPVTQAAFDAILGLDVLARQRLFISYAFLQLGLS